VLWTPLLYILARSKEGLELLRRFVGSFGKTAASVPHDLILIYKGFEWSRLDPPICVDQYLAPGPKTAIRSGPWGRTS
jgi:hypothetical protein